MKTIFFIIDTLEAGGSERILSELSNFLSKKYKIFLITISQPRKVKDFYLLNKNIKRIRIYENFKNENILIKIFRFVILLNKLKKIIIKEKPEACISFLTFSNLLNVFCSLIYKNTRCIISERINPKLIKKNFIYNILSFIFYRFADALVVQSKSIRNSLKNYNKNIKIIYNHVRSIKNRKKYNFKTINFLSISRLDHQKNIFFLIKSFSNLVHYNKNFKLDIIGDGPLKKKIKTFIDNLKVSKNVKLLGIKNNVEKNLRNSKFYIHTALTEGMSNALLEAMSSNVPCIILKHHSQHEFFKNGENCFILDTSKETKFSKKVLEITKMKKNKIDTLINKAKNSINKINIKNIALKWENLI